MAGLTGMEKKIIARYDRYERELAKAKSKAGPLAGYMGMGADPRRHPCNESFLEDLEALIREFLEQQPDGEGVCRVTEFILMAPDANREKPTFWYLFAAQKYTAALIPMLSQADCARLFAAYEKAYPAKQRLPAQEKIYKMLKKHSG